MYFVFSVHDRVFAKPKLITVYSRGYRKKPFVLKVIKSARKRRSMAERRGMCRGGSTLIVYGHENGKLIKRKNYGNK